MHCRAHLIQQLIGYDKVVPQGLFLQLVEVVYEDFF